MTERNSKEMAEEAPSRADEPDTSSQQSAVQESFESPPKNRAPRLADMRETDEDLG
jgi:hypothetical protein